MSYTFKDVYIGHNDIHSSILEWMSRKYQENIYIYHSVIDNYFRETLAILPVFDLAWGNLRIIFVDKSIGSVEWVRDYSLSTHPQLSTTPMWDICGNWADVIDSHSD